MSNYLIDGGSHIDVPLSQLAMKVFDGGGDFVASRLFPAVPVDKQSDGYYVMDPDTWLRIPDTKRAPKSPVKRSEWKVSTDTYFAHNRAHGTDHAMETIANADAAIRIRQTSTMFVTELMLRDLEQRVANQVTSISNVGSGVTLTGTQKWGDYANSDPISDVMTGTAFIENNTGLQPNTVVVDKDTDRILRFHPVLRDYIKYTQSGPVPTNLLQEVFQVDNYWVTRGIYNAAKEGQTASLVNIWGNTFLLTRVTPPSGLQTATFGLGFRWQPEGFPSPFAVERYPHHDRSRKAEVIDSQYFQDEKVVAKNLAYLIAEPI
jgi:hypothetical protein